MYNRPLRNLYPCTEYTTPSNPIDILDITHHQIKLLRQHGILTINDILDSSRDDLHAIPGIGYQSVDHIEYAIMKYQKGTVNPKYTPMDKPNTIYDSAIYLPFNSRVLKALNVYFDTYESRYRTMLGGDTLRETRWSNPVDIQIADVLAVDIESFMRIRDIGVSSINNLIITLYDWCLQHGVQPSDHKVFHNDFLHNTIRDLLSSNGINIHVPNGSVVVRKPHFEVTQSPVDIHGRHQQRIVIKYNNRHYNVGQNYEHHVGYPTQFKLGQPCPLIKGVSKT